MNENSDKPSNAFRIDPNTTVGAVTLGVGDLAKMVQFYNQVVGLNVINRSEASAELGIGKKPLVILEKKSGGKEFPRSTGLYHMAILLPSRKDLGHWLTHLISSQYPLNGAGDHIVSEALYLSDPEGNGIEMYRDRPRDKWEYTENGPRMDTLPVDLESLRAGASHEKFEGLPAGTVMGHVHLKVNNVASAVEFYRDTLGFDLMATLPGAAFLSAGGYHHHIGVNMWNSRGSDPPPAGSLGLAVCRIVLSNEEFRRALLTRLDDMNYPVERVGTDALLRDPAGNGILLQSRA
jgi:catechol 2,3-dioxygenase